MRDYNPPKSGLLEKPGQAIGWLYRAGLGALAMETKCANCSKVLGQQAAGFLDEFTNKAGVKCPMCGRVYCVGCVAERITVWKMQFDCQCGNDEMMPAEGAFVLSRLTVHQPDLSVGGGPGVTVPGVKWHKGPSSQPCAEARRSESGGDKSMDPPAVIATRICAVVALQVVVWGLLSSLGTWAKIGLSLLAFVLGCLAGEIVRPWAGKSKT
jgi:DNA-directed RNA polymerase subunit RPC12/RpoP